VVCPGLNNENPYDEESKEEWHKLREDVIKCKNEEEAIAVAYVTKMQPISSRLYDIVTRA
jgi:hypothetical protein